mmetsp:Transcript_4491/g.13446  ORF Transcript_4491/g.13446 Transcript_4491/m.13446 type:complete len:219 (-) Transcript_4491:1076-1732(-)
MVRYSKSCWDCCCLRKTPPSCPVFSLLVTRRCSTLTWLSTPRKTVMVSPGDVCLMVVVVMKFPSKKMETRLDSSSGYGDEFVARAWMYARSSSSGVQKWRMSGVRSMMATVTLCSLLLLAMVDLRSMWKVADPPAPAETPAVAMVAKLMSASSSSSESPPRSPPEVALPKASRASMESSRCKGIMACCGMATLVMRDSRRWDPRRTCRCCCCSSGRAE